MRICSVLAVLCVFSPFAAAHLPVFPDLAKTYDVDDHIDWHRQSIGMYLTFPKSGDSQTFEFTLSDVDKHDKLALSVSVPAQYKAGVCFETTDTCRDDNDCANGVSCTVVTFKIDGGIEPCDTEYNGWNTHDDDDDRRRALRRLTDIDSATLVKPKEQFEMFGVGVYRPVSTCKTEFTAAKETVKVTVILPDGYPTALPIAIGLGEAEQWANFYNPALQLKLLKVYDWSGRNHGLMVGIIVTTMLLSFGWWVFRRHRVRAQQWGANFPPFNQPLEHVRTGLELGAILMLVSPVFMLWQLCWVGTKAEKSHASGFSSAAFMHVVLPLLAIYTVKARNATCTLDACATKRTAAEKWAKDKLGTAAAKVTPQVAQTYASKFANNRGGVIAEVLAITYLMLFTWQSYFVGDAIMLYAVLTWVLRVWCVSGVYTAPPQKYQRVDRGGNIAPVMGAQI